MPTLRMRKRGKGQSPDDDGLWTLLAKVHPEVTIVLLLVFSRIVSPTDGTKVILFTTLVLVIAVAIAIVRHPPWRK